MFNIQPSTVLIFHNSFVDLCAFIKKNKCLYLDRMDKVRQAYEGAYQQSQPGTAVSAAEQDWGQPQAF